MGVDELMTEAVNNRFEQCTTTAKIENTIKVPMTQTSTLTKPQPVAAAEVSNIDLKSVDTLQALRTAVENFKDLSICKTAMNTVFADGNPDAEIMFMGEAPGADEDRQGVPFCGASGQLLAQMLACIGLKREENFYITNSIFWRPPGNRKPTPQELAACAPFVEKHIALFKPKLIILVGATAVTALFGKSKPGISKVRGTFFDYQNALCDDPIKTTAIFHPSYLLRSPGQKRLIWQDLLTIKHFIKEQNLTL